MVARRPDPIEDAMVIQEVRKKVGHQINLRADANRKRTYEETVLFGSSVMNCGLQYIEVNLETRVGFNTSVARGLIEEAKCVNADFLVVGHSRNRISREITRYCFEHAPEGCSVVSLRKCAVPQQNSDLNTLHIEEHCQMISKWSNENDRMDKSSVTKTKREKMFSPRTMLDVCKGESNSTGEDSSSFRDSSITESPPLSLELKRESNCLSPSLFIHDLI